MIFNEVYGSYYNVVAGILAEAVQRGVTREGILRIIREKGYLESGITIPKALEHDWPLLREDGSTPIRHVPTMPLTDLEKQWMKAICQDPRVRLFDPPMEELADVEPLFEQDFFVWFDRYGDGDPFEDALYQVHFRAALQALREKRWLQITYHGKRGLHQQALFPERLEYSGKDDKFRLIARAGSGTGYVIRMSAIREIAPMGAAGPTDVEDRNTGRTRASLQNEKKLVVLELIDERNALERAMIHFSDLEKETEKLDQDHYRIRLYYRNTDETEILIRVLSFGPKIRVTAPEEFIGLVRDRLEKQKRSG